MAESREFIRLRSSQIAPNKDAVHPFDAEFGTDTGGYFSPREIVTGHAHDAHQYGYSAIAPSVFRQIIARWRATLADPQPTSSSLAANGPAAYSFVDIGAGKGRALLLASELPFRKVIGVELSAELAQTAQANIERWKRAGRPQSVIHVLQKDALQFCWPRTPLLVFLYNPFDCDLLERLLERLEAAASCASSKTDVSSTHSPRQKSRGRINPAHILYANPTCADELSKRGRWVLKWTDRFDMDERDQLADPYGTTWDRVSCYRLRE